jgi:hypothetical protein
VSGIWGTEGRGFKSRQPDSFTAGHRTGRVGRAKRDTSVCHQLAINLDELIVNTIHDLRGVVSTNRLHVCASRVVVGGSHSHR